ncbi:MAG: hypothetical protein K9N40_12850 [Candidatus Cloacimonetes bacterium]|nr:hypothetical protein [Candidatus Cloacimonadota bacterium]
MSWEFEDKFYLITEDNIDEMEEAHNKGNILSGVLIEDLYVIKSSSSGYVEGMTSGKRIFEAIRSMMIKTRFSSSDDREIINHWRWFPRNSHYAGDKNTRAEGGTLVHMYTSRDTGLGHQPKNDFTRLSELHEDTQKRETMEGKILNGFFRNGNPMKAMGIGAGEILWTKGNGHISFSHRKQGKTILTI